MFSLFAPAHVSLTVSSALKAYSNRENVSTVCIYEHDFANEDPNHSFLTEAFSSSSKILFSCEEYLLNVILSDAYWCGHYNSVNYFTARLCNHWFHSIKRCDQC